jgi:hypothetical protein
MAEWEKSVILQTEGINLSNRTLGADNQKFTTQQLQRNGGMHLITVAKGITYLPAHLIAYPER